MTVPASEFSLDDVRIEVGLGSTASLTDCIAEAGETGTWDRLSDFANYTHEYLTINVSELYFDDTGVPQQNIVVSSNVSWSVSDNQSWILTSGASGSGNDTFQVECFENFSSARQGIVTVIWTGTNRTCDIYQAAP